MFALTYLVPALFSTSTSASISLADLDWHPPNATWINDLDAVINSTGTYGFIFNNSQLPDGVPYGTYNYCNMPHVRVQEYEVPDPEYKLEYVEVIHRHHKRTPYATNTFPHESYPWDCSDVGLFHYGLPLNPSGNASASTYWSVYTSPSNPFAPNGFNGTCQFPQLTRGGLDDAWQHGQDLWAVYRDLLHFLPDAPGQEISIRVTNNVITSQVAGMVVGAMYPASAAPFPLHVQPASVDSLEPAYACPAAIALYKSYGVGSTREEWTRHLDASKPLFRALDAVSGVPEDDAAGFRVSWDHYFDNLSARQCHGKPLPCAIGNVDRCVSQAMAEQVYRLGQYEYSYLYRGAPESLQAAVGSFGVWIAELAHSIRNVVAGDGDVRYRHNVAHDGSVSRLLAILQVEEMVWPGMGAEVVFEVYSKHNKDGKEGAMGHFVRVLWGGRVLRSSNPGLGVMDMVDVEVLLEYFDGLVGVGARKVPGICEAS